MNIVHNYCGKSGIYRIQNILNGKFYIGSSTDLGRRIGEHINSAKKNKNGCTILQNAWNKYGQAAFVIGIVEFCEEDKTLEREQWYFDNLKPEYNIYKIAGSPKGYKHSKEVREKMINHPKNIERRRKISELIKQGKSDNYVREYTGSQIPTIHKVREELGIFNVWISEDRKIEIDKQKENLKNSRENKAEKEKMILQYLEEGRKNGWIRKKLKCGYHHIKTLKTNNESQDY